MTLREAIQRNEMQPCSVPECGYRRYKLNNTCIHHFFRKKLHGHPKARAIRKKELKHELAQVTELIERNRDHEGVKGAIEWLDRWLQAAAEGKRVPGAYHLRRLHGCGKTGLDLLKTCAATWLYSYRYPRILPDDISLVYQLTHQIMKLIPLEYIRSRTGKRRAVVMKSRDKEAIGQHIRGNLGVLFVNMVRSILGKEESAMELRNQMAKPLS